MVLVDTSVWIRALAGRAPWKGYLDALLATEQVLAHELVYGELLIGDTGGRQRFLSEYATYDIVGVASHDEVAGFVRTRKLAGRGLSWIDAHLLASALIAGARLWSADQDLRDAAADIGVEYAPGPRPARRQN